MASTLTLEPIAPEDFGVLITGPAKRASLSLEDGLETRLVKESGGRDALPLLAFVLEKLWKARTDQCLTLKAYEDLEGVGGAVGKRAKECWDPETSSEEVRQALREAFLDHLVSVAGDGAEAKRPAPLAALPLASREIVQKMVDDRLLVLNDGIVEIAHEALLRTWEPLVRWLEESQEERLQGLRVKRLTADLVAEAPERQRRQALEQLAGLAAAGGIERKAVVKEGQEPLAKLLANPAAEEADRLDAALILALIGAEEPLSACLADGEAPVELRRRAAESLGLLAKRGGDREQRDRIAAELEGWLRAEELDVGIAVELDPKRFDPAMVQGVWDQTRQQVAEGMPQAKQSGQLPPDLTEAQVQEIFQDNVQPHVVNKLQAELWASGGALGWAEHDRRLPLLQGASRGLQLAASADLPLLGNDRETRVPMLTLTALQEGDGLRIRTEVVTPAVWRLPLPEAPGVPPQQLELVVVEGGEYPIGSPPEEDGRDWYATQRDGCKDPQTNRPLNVEAQRRVRLEGFGMVRHLITQAQWQAVALLPRLERDLNPTPGTYEAKGLWETHAQPDELPVDSVSWFDCKEWLGRLNRWLLEQWSDLGGQGAAPQLTLPGEGQWEAACRAGASTPFHFGDTLDASWANCDGGYAYGLGRKGPYRQRPVPVGFFGLVNRWGLAELHGNLAEWCGDQWHPDPTGAGWPGAGLPWEGVDPALEALGTAQKEMRLLRGGSWFYVPLICRAACRSSNLPANVLSIIGVRPCCLLPPGSLLGS